MHFFFKAEVIEDMSLHSEKRILFCILNGLHHFFLYSFIPAGVAGVGWGGGGVEKIVVVEILNRSLSESGRYAPFATEQVSPALL